KEISYQNYYKPSTEINIPEAYIIPQGWHSIIDLLKLNAVEYTQFKTDTTLTIESYKVVSYNTRTSPYEGHYLHYNSIVKASDEEITFRKGDYLISTQQKAVRYLLETLEPTAPDSFFNWDFFDTILQQ